MIDPLQRFATRAMRCPRASEVFRCENPIQCPPKNIPNRPIPSQPFLHFCRSIKPLSANISAGRHRDHVDQHPSPLGILAQVEKLHNVEIANFKLDLIVFRFANYLTFELAFADWRSLSQV